MITRVYGEERGWADEAVMKTVSRLDVPTHRAQVPVRGEPIDGVTFSGNRVIQKGEFSWGDYSPRS